MSKHHPICSERIVNQRSRASWRAGALILAAVNIGAVATADASTFYVAETGNDANAGTIGSPWKSIQFAANRVQAGDTVYIRGGTYVESVTLKVSGKAGSYITFQSFPGEVAKVSGRTLTATGNQGLIDIVNQSYIEITGLEILDYTTSRADATPIGIRIAGTGRAIKISKNHIHDISNTASPAATADCSGSNPNAHGLLVRGDNAASALSEITVDGNELNRLTLGCSESLAINGNVQNWSITNNIIHDNDNIGIDAIGFEQTSSDTKTDQARDGAISGNTMYNLTTSRNKAYANSPSAAGIYCDGCIRVTIERNTIHDNDYGVEAASEHSGRTSSNVTVRNNLIYGNALAGLTIGGAETANGGTDNCIFVNNSFYNNDTSASGSGEFQIQNHVTNNMFENNIVYAGSENMFIIGTTSSSTVTSDYNLYFSAGGTSAGQWKLGNGTYTGFSDYVGRSKQDKGSKFADPQYLNLATHDLRVAKTSPAVGVGNNLPATNVGNMDFAGNARVQGGKIDIGAYEQ